MYSHVCKQKQEHLLFNYKKHDSPSQLFLALTVCTPNLNMQCPACGEVRYSKHWKRSQWVAWTAEVHEYNCCKLCSRDGYVSRSLEQQHQAAQCVQDLYQTFLLCTANGWRDHIRLFVEAWVSSEYCPRQRLSHYGAIRRSILTHHGCKIPSSTELGRTPWGQKCKYIDPDHYFDPGNWHYKICFVLLFGDVPWNENTVGDILESILGTRYLIENEGLACTHFPFAFATFLEMWCVALYRWFECTAWCNKSIAKVREALLISEISDVI